MIPKIIHYFWFGKNKKPTIVIKCIDSWRRYMPEYKIIEWNESNYDIHKSKYMEEAYSEKKWAFVTDYARFDVLNQYGGIYFDTDVELLKSIPSNILSNNAFTGIESAGTVNPGLVFGSIPSHPFLSQILDKYDSSTFHLRNDKTYKTVNEFSTEILAEYGFIQNNQYQFVDDIAIYPSSYFCGYDQDTHTYDIQNNTISVHHYAGTWVKKSIKKNIKRYITKIMIKVMGKNQYKKILMIKRKFFGISKV